MKIGIISTFPKQGSRNIGDHLITQSTEAAVNAVLPEATFTRFFRADAWSGIAEEIQKQDHLVFACLAIRHRDMQNGNTDYSDCSGNKSASFALLSTATGHARRPQRCIAAGNIRPGEWFFNARYHYTGLLRGYGRHD